MNTGPILVTGATGFLGQHVCRALVAGGVAVRGLVRSADSATIAGVTPFPCADLSDRPALRRALRGADAVIHLAARAHVMRDAAADPLAEYRRTNVEGTRAVVEEALAAGVPRLVFASSVKAVGEASTTPWTEATPALPTDPYGISKLEAERVVAEAAGSGAMATTVLRLPLVYGPGMKANMLRLFDIVDRGVPLPLGSVRNRRSLVFTGNVAAAIQTVIATPAAAGEVFFVRDLQEASTPDLIRAIARALGRPARLVPVPIQLFRLAGRAGDMLSRFVRMPIGTSTVSKLFGSLSVDASRIALVTGFRPPYSMEEGLRITAEWYRRHVGARP